MVAYVIKADRKLGFVKMSVALRPSAVTETYIAATEMMSYTKLIQYIQSESVVMAKVKGGWQMFNNRRFVSQRPFFNYM